MKKRNPHTQHNRRLTIGVLAHNARQTIERSAHSQRAYLLQLVDGVRASIAEPQFGRTPRIGSGEARTMRRMIAFAVREAGGGQARMVDLAAQAHRRTMDAIDDDGPRVPIISRRTATVAGSI